MPPSRSATTRLSNWQEKLLPLAGQAMALVAPVRIEEISKRLAVGGEPVADSEDAAMLLQAGVIDIALFTAPPGRSTAVERLAKQLRPKPSSDDGKLLAGMLKARLAQTHASGGRDLVPVKRGVIDDELEKLGISFQTKAARAPRVLSDAYDAGREASAGFEYRPGVGGPGDGR